jgi:hypothetical protein
MLVHLVGGDGTNETRQLLAQLNWFFILALACTADAAQTRAKMKNPHRLRRYGFHCRGGKIRTCDLLLPKQAR